MDRIPEFVGNHTLQVVAFIAVLGMLIYTEWTRARTGNTALSPFAATRLLNDGDALVVDVRDEREYKAGHVLNAKNVPVGSMDQRLHELQKYKSRDVLVYCDNGMRTARAVSRLKKEGFDKVHTIAGGLAAWEKASLPTVTR